jgi:hypothetical protein
MNFKMSLATAVICATAIFGAPAAYAADVSHTVQTVDLSQGSHDYGSSFGRNNKGNTFTDAFSFVVGAGNGFSALTSSISPTNGSDLMSLTGFKLYSSVGALIGSGTQESTGKTDQWSLDLSALSAGTYTLKVSGSILTNSGASFGGNINLVPVPEPETYAMMLAGLGLVGFIGRRKRQAKAAKAAA